MVSDIGNESDIETSETDRDNESEIEEPNFENVLVMEAQVLI